jgi:hypothetical protein
MRFEDTIAPVCCTSVVLFVAVCVVLSVVLQRRQQAAMRQVEALRNQPGTVLAMYSWSGNFQVEQLHGGRSPRKSFVLAVSPDEITIYRRGSDTPFVFLPGQIRWFGRPEKYVYGKNEIWLHLEMEHHWHILKIRLDYDSMRDLVRALKQVVPEELVIAYRRRRPYVHYDLVTAKPATQDIHGAWTLDEPVSLYLMPRYLVILQDVRVSRLVALDSIQEIGALRRLDEPEAQGLVRFLTGDEKMAFALDSHDVFAEALAEAARRTLEDPIIQKQKKKSDEDEDFDEDE